MALIIKELLRERGLTSEALAKHLGVKPPTVSQIINGNPTLSKLQEIADFLDVHISDLFERPVRYFKDEGGRLVDVTSEILELKKREG